MTDFSVDKAFNNIEWCGYTTTLKRNSFINIEMNVINIMF